MYPYSQNKEAHTQLFYLESLDEVQNSVYY
jgi:hypothetical protein